MITGHIESYDEQNQTGTIASNGQLYPFHAADWQLEVPPEPGDDVRFEVSGGAAQQVSLVGAYLEKTKPVKYKYLAAALGLVFGFAGVHRFYLGFYKIGLAQLAVTVLTQGYGVLWGFIETVLIFAGHINKDAKGRPLK